MTVSNTTRKQSFTLNGSTSTFDFTFRALTSAPTDIKCTTTISSVDTNLTYTTDYTVVVNANGEGGTVTLVDAASIGSGTLTVYRETTNTQASDYDDYNQFPADTLETDLDIRTMVSQEISERNDRALTLSITTDSGVSATLPNPAADLILGWNATATGIENKTIVDATTLTKATQSQAATGTNDTAFMTPKTVFQGMMDKASDIASGNSIDIGASEGVYIDITGTTQINALGTVQAGTQRILQFDGSLTLSHSTTALILPGSANITTEAGDTAAFVSLGSGNWKCLWYQRISGLSATELVSTTTIGNDATVEVTGLESGFDYIFSFQNVKPVTDSVSYEMRTSADNGATYDSGQHYAEVDSTTATSIRISGNQIGNGTGESYSGDVIVFNPADTKQTYVRAGYTSHVASNDLIQAGSNGGKRNSAAAVDAVQFLPSSGNFTAGTLRVFRRRIS